MTRLDLARKRLDAALETLEKAAKSAAQIAVPASGEKRESGSLAAETERQALLTRVAELEDELAAVSGASAEVETRLDGAIGEIRAALAR